MIHIFIVVKPRGKARSVKYLARNMDKLIESLGYRVVLFDIKSEDKVLW